MAYLDRQKKMRYYYNARYAIVRKGGSVKTTHQIQER